MESHRNDWRHTVRVLDQLTTAYEMLADAGAGTPAPQELVDACDRFLRVAARLDRHAGREEDTRRPAAAAPAPASSEAAEPTQPTQDEDTAPSPDIHNARDAVLRVFDEPGEVLDVQGTVSRVKSMGIDITSSHASNSLSHWVREGELRRKGRGQYYRPDGLFGNIHSEDSRAQGAGEEEENIDGRQQEGESAVAG